MTETGPVYQEQWTSTKDMNREELIAEIDKWRSMWTWTSEDAKWLLTKVGKTIRVITRSNVAHLGVLLLPKLILEEMEVGVLEKQYDHNVGEYFHERKVIKIPASSIQILEVIEERKRFEELDGADLSALSLETVEEV